MLDVILLYFGQLFVLLPLGVFAGQHGNSGKTVTTNGSSIRNILFVLMLVYSTLKKRLQELRDAVT